MAKVTIIIPIYNVAGFVRKTIDSVCTQTEMDIEIILVNDGSTDNSGSICDEVAQIDTRIKVIHKQNGGLSSARNAGTNAATSKFVMFLDGDDYLREDAVECCLKAMQEYPCDFVQFLYQEVEDGQEPVLRQSKETVYQATCSKELFKNLYRLGGVAASGATKFMHRELALDIPFEDIQHEDEMWCTKAFLHDLTVTYIQDKLYFYVMRENSIIHSKFNEKKLDAFMVSDSRIQVLKQLSLTEYLSNEYQRIFSLILSLYHQSRKSHALDFQSLIEEKFHAYQYDIGKYAKLHGKYLLIYNLMKCKFNFIRLYDWYWTRKE